MTRSVPLRGPRKPTSTTRARTSLAVVIAVATLVLAVLGAGSYSNAAALVEETTWVVHDQVVLDQLGAALGVVEMAESAERGYLLTGDRRYLESYDQAVGRWSALFRMVQEETRRQTSEQADFQALVRSIDARLQELADTIALYDAGKKPEAMKMVATNQGPRLMASIRTLVDSLRDKESKVLASRLAAERAKAVNSSGFILVLGLLVVGAGVLGLFLLRRAEDRGARTASQLRGIIDGSSDAVAAIDKNHRLLLFNDAFVQFHQNYNRTTPQIGDVVYSLIQSLGDSLKHEVAEFYSRALTGEEFTVLYERPFEGQTRFFDWRFSPIRDESGKLIGSAQIMRDITQDRQAELQFEDYARRLEISNRELTDFAFVASHDLQEPLRKILAFGERLKVGQGDRLTAEGLDHLKRMQNAAIRMQTLIRDLLDYSRVTTKGQPPEPVDLNKVLTEVLSDLHLRIQETGALIEVPAFPVVAGDPTQLRQLFQNLLGNALKYHRTGVPPVVSITVEPSTDSPCRFVVRDNGIGFEPRHAEKIFEIFQRLHGRGEFEGTGIGLAICRKIVARHGGTITAEGCPGEGATFTITFPDRFWTPTPRRPA